MTTRNPQYTDTFRTSAVLMLEAAGYPNTLGALNRVSNHLGVPRQTLQRWSRGTRNPPPPEMVTITRRDIVDLLEDIIYGTAGEVKDRIDNGELDAVTLPQLMTVAAIAIDKKQLLSNAPTQTIQHMNKDISDEERRARMKELARAIADELNTVDG